MLGLPDAVSKDTVSSPSTPNSSRTWGRGGGVEDAKMFGAESDTATAKHEHALQDDDAKSRGTGRSESRATAGTVVVSNSLRTSSPFRFRSSRRRTTKAPRTNRRPHNDRAGAAAAASTRKSRREITRTSAAHTRTKAIRSMYFENFGPTQGAAPSSISR